MTSKPEKVGQKEGEIRLDASQLRPGVHVRLPIPWIDHHFMFNSFVITSEEQAKQIIAMRLPYLYCDPTLCKAPPLPKSPEPVEVDPAREAEAARLSSIIAAQMAEKVERTKVMSELRGRLDVAQKHFIGASKVISGALSSFAANPEESIKQVNLVSKQSTTALLADPDSAIVLISEKAQTDGHASHSLSVMTLALLLGKQALLPKEALHTLGVSALLHDIGRLSISSSILRNSSRNKHEEAIYQTHSKIGYDMALRSGGLPPPVLDAILHHHERVDGSGFPDRLRNKEIHVAARVISIANRFDNLANPVDYLHARSPSEALATMWTKERAAFDPTLLQLFIRAMGVYPPGSIVLLSDGRVGAVVGSAMTEAPLSPQVLIYEPEVPRRQAIIIDLAKDSSLKIERALRLQGRPEEELDYLLPRRKLNWFHSEGQK